MRLSIGQAWSETRAVLARDGDVIAIVALALLVLPGTLVGLASPVTVREPDGLANVLGLLSALIGFAGQLAISRIAIGPAQTVGQSIAGGLRRLPVFVLATFMWTVPLLVVLVAIMRSSGVDLTQTATPNPPSIGVLLAILLVTLLMVLLGVRMLFTAPLAAVTRLGPVSLLKRSWALTSGNMLRLLGMLILVLIAALVLVFGLGSAIGAVVILLLGQPAPWNVSALLIAMAQQILGAVISVPLAVLVARCYAQLAGDAAPVASVPDAGHH